MMGASASNFQSFSSYLRLLISSLVFGITLKFSSVMYTSFSWQSEYPKFTQLLAKILEGLLSRSNVGDKIHHYEEVSFMMSILSILMYYYLTLY